ncbi:MAG: methyltransferase [Gemmatimonadetes bacterium]|nr:methyltransferase [Gemmatimonadota bacterium]
MEVVDEVDRMWAAEVLVVAGARAVVETDRGLKTHFAEPAAGPEGFLGSLESSLVESGLAASIVSWRWQRHEDWATLWRQGLGPRRVGRRIVVHPSWTESPSGQDDIDLTIDPGIAFGTAEHATTRLALALLEPRVEPGQWVADVGTGTGILGIAAARLGAARVLAYDTDPYAWSVTRENALRNGVPTVVQVVEGPMEEGAPEVEGLVVNIEWVRLAPLIPSLSTRVRSTGWMVLSGVLNKQRETALVLVRDLGWVVVDEAVEEEWWAVALSRAAA